MAKVYVPRAGSKDWELPSVILIEEGKDQVAYLTDTQIGHPDYPAIALERTPTKTFMAAYAPLKSPEPGDLLAAAKVYREHAHELGATTEALAELGKLINIEKEGPKIVAPPKKTTETDEKPKVTTAAKAELRQAATKAQEKAQAEKAARPPAAKKPVKERNDEAPKERAPTVSSTMQALIMEGKLTDDQIFAETKKRFPDLDDSKRAYVGWYRNHLRKQGANPPEPITDEAPTKRSAKTSEKPVEKAEKPSKVTSKIGPGAGRRRAA